MHFDYGCHFFTTNLHFYFDPENLRTVLAGSNPNHHVWISAYNEEYDSL